MDTLIVAVVFAVTATAALVQGTVGVGFAMVAVPVTSLIAPELAPVPQLLIVLPLTVSMAWRERHAMDLTGVGWIIAGRFPGAAIGVALLSVATQRTLDLFIGGVVLAAVAVIATGFRVHRNPATKFAAGVGAGTTGLVASMGGPPIALIYNDDEAATIRSTLAAVFTIGVTISTIVRFGTGNVTARDLRTSLILFPAVVIGYAVSVRVKDAIPRNTVRSTILIVSAVAGVLLLVRAAWG